MKQKRSYNKFLLMIVVSALLIFLHYSKIISPLETLIINILKPGLSTTYGVSNNINELYEESLIDVNWQDRAESLEAENIELMMSNSQLQYLKVENETLRQYLNFFENSQYDYLIARVINKQLAVNNIIERNKLIINKGSRHGLRSGLLVVEQAGMIIGRLSAVNKDWSEVVLITSPQCRLAISIQPSNEVMGVAQGESGLTVKIGLIPQTAVVSIDDMVVTSGLEENVPRAMIVGRVSQVNKESNELWQEALVEPLAKLDNLSIVSVIIPQITTE